MFRKTIPIIFFCCLFCSIAGSEPQATSVFTITLTFQGATQVIADQVKSDAAADYGAAYGLDVFVLDGNGKPTAVVDPVKAAAAIRAHIKQHITNVVVAYRARQAAAVTQATTEATERAKVVIQ